MDEGTATEVGFALGPGVRWLLWSERVDADFPLGSPGRATTAAAAAATTSTDAAQASTSDAVVTPGATTSADAAQASTSDAVPTAAPTTSADAAQAFTSAVAGEFISRSAPHAAYSHPSLRNERWSDWKPADWQQRSDRRRWQPEGREQQRWSRQQRPAEVAHPRSFASPDRSRSRRPADPSEQPGRFCHFDQ